MVGWGWGAGNEWMGEAGFMIVGPGGGEGGDVLCAGWFVYLWFGIWAGIFDGVDWVGLDWIGDGG